MKHRRVFLLILCALVLLSTGGCKGAGHLHAPLSWQLPEATRQPAEPSKPPRTFSPPETGTPSSEETPGSDEADELRPYYLHGSPLAWRWVGESTQDSFAYELNILPTGSFWVYYRDYTLADGAGEDNITWLAGGDVRQEGDRLYFTLTVDGAEFAGEYVCHMEPGGLFLQNCGTERIFADLEREAEENSSQAVYFRRELPRIAYLAPAFALCGVYDRNEACEQHFWELITAAACLDWYSGASEDEPLPDRLRCDAAEAARYAWALFGDDFAGTLPDTAGSQVTFADGAYIIPFLEDAAACRAEGVELLYDGAAMLDGGILVEVCAGGNEPVYLKLQTQPDNGAAFGTQLVGLERVIPTSGADIIAAAVGTHSYCEFAAPNINMDYTLTIPADTGEGAATLQIQGFQTYETLPLRIACINGALCACYAGETTALYDEGCLLFSLHPAPDGGLTLVPQELYTLYGAALEEEP